MKLILKTVLLALLTAAPFTTANAYESCYAYASQHIQDKSPAAQAEIKQLCREYSGSGLEDDPIDCSVSMRRELPAVLMNAASWRKALEFCTGNSHQMVMCTRSALSKGPRNAPIEALESTLQRCMARYQ